jgi:hypothetical protein
MRAYGKLSDLDMHSRRIKRTHEQWEAYRVKVEKREERKRLKKFRTFCMFIGGQVSWLKKNR